MNLLNRILTVNPEDPLEDLRGDGATPHAGLWSNHQPLRGRDWLRRVSAEDRQAFSKLGRMYANNGKLGGLIRAATGERDENGRFIRKGVDNGKEINGETEVNAEETLRGA